MTGLMPERATSGQLCEFRLGHGAAQFPCTLPRDHDERNDGEPHFAIEVPQAVRAWQAWKVYHTDTSRIAHQPAGGAICTGFLIADFDTGLATCDVCGAEVEIMTTEEWVDPVATLREAMTAERRANPLLRWSPEYGGGMTQDAVAVMTTVARAGETAAEFTEQLIDVVDKALDEMDDAIEAEPIVAAMMEFAASWRKVSR